MKYAIIILYSKIELNTVKAAKLVIRPLEWIIGVKRQFWWFTEEADLRLYIESE